MKVTKIALALGFALSMGLSAPVAMANGSELIKSGSSAHVDYQSRRINQAKSIVKQITDAVPDSEFISRGDRMTDVEKQAYAFQRQQFRLYMAKEQVNQMELHAKEEKVNLMLASLAGADVSFGYELFVSQNKMPFPNQDIEKARSDFANTPFTCDFVTTHKCESLHMRNEVVKNAYFDHFMPESIAYDLNNRIHKIKSVGSDRDYDSEKEMENIRYDLNALAEVDVPDLADSEEFIFSEKAKVYVTEIRSYIESLLHETKVGKLQFEIDEDEMNNGPENSFNKISENFDDALDQVH